MRYLCDFSLISDTLSLSSTSLLFIILLTQLPFLTKRKSHWFLLRKKSHLLIISLFYLWKITANGARPKRQTTDEPSATKKEESFEQELCKDKDAGEWFRLVTGEGDNCRDVIQCTSSVRTRTNDYLWSFVFLLIARK